VSYRPEQLAPAGRRPLVADPRPLFGFFTRLRLGGDPSLEAVIAAFAMVPLVGWVTGMMVGLAALLLAGWLPSVLVAALVLAGVVALTGLNAMDGLLDLGDGLMVHGDTERRLAAMHDHSAGVGAIGLVLFVYLLAFAALATLVQLAPAAAARAPVAFASAAQAAAAGVLLAEVLARVPYVIIAWLGRASHSGLGSAFLAGFGTRHAALGLTLAAPALLAGLWVGWTAVGLAFASAVAVALLLLRIAGRLFGGVGGDVFGASQEIGRAAALVGIAAGMAAEAAW
jgi:adenosylcobinamide-GDP ribazoletransferase